jgi:hypothetical protein
VALVCLIGAVVFAWTITENSDPVIGRWLKATVAVLVGIVIWQAYDLVVGLWQIVGLGVVLLVLIVSRQRRQMLRRMATLEQEEAEEQDIQMMHGLGQY